ncbi:MAG: hypothetical protein NWR54_07340 [Paracoccaceae bacterium]|nr:hypothetical protein [Paracoccaceae bacterium]
MEKKMNARIGRLGASLLAATSIVAGSAAFADTSVQAPQASLASPVASLAFPGTFGVPSAVAPRDGTGFLGATYANPRGGVSGSGGDGDLVAGYAVGNPLDAVSLTFGVALTGIDPLGDSGSFSITASRLLRAGGTSATFIGASVSNLLGWGDSADRSEMYSAYVSHLAGVTVGDTEIPFQFTLGYGTDNTRSSDGAGRLSDGMYAGVGVGVTESLSASVSATRTQINVGATLSIPGTSFSTTAGVLDVTDNTDRRQFSLSVGYSF